MLLAILSILAVQVAFSNGFYIPGVAPREYHNGEDLVVKVRELPRKYRPLKSHSNRNVPQRLFPINAHQLDIIICIHTKHTKL